MDFELIEKALPILLLGAGVTIEITAVSVFIGFCIGLFVGIARICKVKVLRILAAIYADCIRGTPLLVQIFLIYFALPIVTGHRVEPSLPAESIAARMYLRFSALVSRRSMWGRWKRVARSAFPGGRPCTISSCRRLYEISCRRSAMNSSQC